MNSLRGAGRINGHIRSLHARKSRTDRACSRIRAQAERLGKRGIKLVPWDCPPLLAEAERPTGTCRRFFGRGWVEAFCGHEKRNFGRSSGC